MFTVISLHKKQASLLDPILFNCSKKTTVQKIYPRHFDTLSVNVIRHSFEESFIFLCNFCVFFENVSMCSSGKKIR